MTGLDLGFCQVTFLLDNLLATLLFQQGRGLAEAGIWGKLFQGEDLSVRVHNLVLSYATLDSTFGSCISIFQPVFCDCHFRKVTVSKASSRARVLRAQEPQSLASLWTGSDVHVRPHAIIDVTMHVEDLHDGTLETDDVLVRALHLGNQLNGTLDAKGLETLDQRTEDLKNAEIGN